MIFEAERRARRWTEPTTGIGEGRGRPLHGPRPILAILVAICGMFLAGCESSDVVPPSGAELTLTATPATLDSSSPGVPESTLRALVTNLGVSLPGQTVRFSTGAGTLTPLDLTPIETDEFGIAESILTTSKTATVTAQSGGTIDTVTISVIEGSPSAILLVSPDVTLGDCLDVINLIATAISTNDLPIRGLAISFEMRNRNGTPGTIGDFVGTFVPGQGVTNTDGEVTTQFRLDQTTCDQECRNGTCEGAVVAVQRDIPLESSPLVILDSIP